MKTDLTGRIRNTTLPRSKGLLTVYEAVVNAIHAIEEKGHIDDEDLITIEIRREAVLDLEDNKKGRKAVGDITEILITDTGAGFHDANFSAFQTLDTPHKKQQGGRGIGRLMWLKAFDKVEIKSYFREASNEIYCRNFFFELPDGVRADDGKPYKVENRTSTGTEIRLIGFEKSYREAAPKQLESIARKILEHCLWFFIRPGGAPTIVLKEESDCTENDRLCLQDVYDSYSDSIPTTVTLPIDNHTFNLDFLKLRNNAGGESKIAYCANNRVVKEEILLPSLGKGSCKLQDTEGPFTCYCYVASEYLDTHVRSDRMDFDFDSDIGTLYENIDTSWNTIQASVQRQIERHLYNELTTYRKAGREKARRFIETKAPRYRYLLNSLPDDFTFSPDASEKDLESTLHKELYKREASLLEEGHSLLIAPETMSLEEYSQSIVDFFQRMDESKNADLAAYIHKRHMVLKLLRKALCLNENEKYEKEEIFHKLIFPMRQTSNSVELMDANLWVIDERLAFHNYLASDKPISSYQITQSDSLLRPDLCVLQLGENVDVAPLALSENPILVSDKKNLLQSSSLTIIEFKRPMRDDFNNVKNPLEQVYEYFSKIESGGLKTYEGRPIPTDKSYRRFAYIICDITPSIRRVLEFAGCQKSKDGDGYYTYNPTLQVQVDIISFDKLLQAAEERNKAFFDKLGLPCL